MNLKVDYTTSSWKPKTRRHKHLQMSSLQAAHSEPTPWTKVWLHSSLVLLPASLHNCAHQTSSHPTPSLDSGLWTLQGRPCRREVWTSITWLTSSSVGTFFKVWGFIMCAHILHARARVGEACTSHTTSPEGVISLWQGRQIIHCSSHWILSADRRKELGVPGKHQNRS